MGVFVHPMDAASAEMAVAYEAQAIGRCRRWGQQRSEVHCWRFVTRGTIEEEITSRHRQELSQRDLSQERRVAAAFAAAPQLPSASFSDLSDSEDLPAPNSKAAYRAGWRPTSKAQVRRRLSAAELGWSSSDVSDSEDLVANWPASRRAGAYRPAWRDLL